MESGWMPDQVVDYIFEPLHELLEPILDRLATLELKVRQYDEIQQKMRRFEEMEAKLQRLEGVEARMTRVEESLQRALGTFLPRVGRLLEELEERPPVPAPRTSLCTSSNATNAQGPATLLEAAKVGDISSIERFLNEGQDADEEDSDEETALMHAVRGGHEEAARLLVDAGADVNVFNSSREEGPLILAAHAGHQVIVEMLVTSGADLDDLDVESCSAVWHAASNGHTSIVEHLMSKGAFVRLVDASDPAHASALEIAAKHGHAKTVKAILAAASRWTYRDLEFALEVTDSPAVVQVIAQICPHGFWEDFGPRLVMSATRNGKIDTLDALLQAGAGTGQRNMGGLTPLHIAASHENLAAIFFLIIYGAEIEALDAKGRTPLHLAAIHGKEKAVCALLAKKADRNARDKRGRTPSDATNSEHIRAILAGQIPLRSV